MPASNERESERDSCCFKLSFRVFLLLYRKQEGKAERIEKGGPIPLLGPLVCYSIESYFAGDIKWRNAKRRRSDWGRRNNKKDFSSSLPPAKSRALLERIGRTITRLNTRVISQVVQCQGHHGQLSGGYRDNRHQYRDRKFAGNLPGYFFLPDHRHR